MAKSTTKGAQPKPGQVPVVLTEIERKLTASAGFAVPELALLSGVAGIAPTRVDELDAVYFDTSDLRLLARHRTLRRRTGGPDAGWHLKSPTTDGERRETHLPLGRSRVVPPEFVAQVAVFARGEALRPVVRLTTRRTVHPVTGSKGQVLAEVAVDEVSARHPVTLAPRLVWGPVQQWHEVEVELVAGDAPLLVDLVEALVSAGARRAAYTSKLARALGDSALGDSALGDSALGDPGPVTPIEGPSRDAGGRRSSGAVLGKYLATHVARLLEWDPRVRADEADAVHQLRVTSRRLRSALATYGSLLERGTAEALRAELGWLGQVLAPARDAEVTRDHLIHLVDSLDPGLVKGAVAERIRQTYDDLYRAAHAAAVAELGSSRYFDLLDRLEALAMDPPWTTAAAWRIEEGLVPALTATWRRLRRLHRRLRALGEQPDEGARDELLHEIRKRAKRSRYAAEVVRSQAVVSAAVWGQVMGELQEVLGEQHDSVVVRAEILELATAAAAAGEDGFSYGVLFAGECERGRLAEAAFDGVWRATRRAMTARGRRLP